MPVLPDLSVADLLAGDPDQVWISRWVPLAMSEIVVGYTGVSQRPAEMPLALFGWGEAARFTARGPRRLAELQSQWENWLGGVDRPSGWHAFLAATFADDSKRDSVLVVPEVLALHFANRTEFLALDESAVQRLVPRLGASELGVAECEPVSAVPGELTPRRYAAAVGRALSLIRRGSA